MKINNEYINTKNYTENFFTEDLNAGVSENPAVTKSTEGVIVSKGENIENTEFYNRFGGENSDKRLLEESDMARDEDDEAVTVLERIQIQLMTYCDNYNASGLNIDKAKLEKVLGSPALAESVSKLSDLSKFNDNTKEFMLKNNLEPTVENVYMAMHSSGNREVAPLTDEAVINAVTDKLKKEGYELNETNRENALWLVARGIELTTKNMSELSALNQIDKLALGDEQAMLTLTENMAYSILAGQTGKSAYLTDKYVDITEVDEVIDAVKQAKDEDIAYISANNLPFSAASLQSVMASDKTSLRAEDYTSIQVVEYRQTIYEARLVMTQESVYNLKRLGVNIRYADLTDMTESIKNQRNKLIDTLLNITEENADTAKPELFNNTYNIMTAFSSIPNAVIGQVYRQEISFTVTEIYASGAALQKNYEAAMTSYETLGTEVRRDLGDSYAKAFSNVDKLLDELGMEVNGANQRAVRILGYNSIEIIRQSVTAVREIATELDYLIDNMTPKTAMQLIKEGINPLEDNIRDVNAMLESINEKNGKDEENMGRFLWNLEKKGEVTEQEKSDYIELYRILNMVSKNDGNVIGRVLNNGQELTLKNLYSAYKSKKTETFDYSVSDEATVTYAKRSLTSFMENASALTELVENGEVLDASLETMLDMAHRQATDYEEALGYEEIRNLTEAELSLVVRNLDTHSVANIAAYMNMSNAKEFRKKLEEYKEAEETVEKINAQIEGEGELADIREQFEKLDVLGEKISENAKNQKDISYEKLQGMLLMKNTLKLMAGNSRKNSYYIPMDIAGEITKVHLTIKSNAKAVNSVRVSMENQTLGKLSSIFTIKAETVEGMVLTDRADTTGIISAGMSTFTQIITVSGLKVGNIEIAEGTEEILDNYAGESDENIGTNTYYSVAKAFIGMIKTVTEAK